jgi:hypothetical protein
MRTRHLRNGTYLVWLMTALLIASIFNDHAISIFYAVGLNIMWQAFSAILSEK